MLRLSIPGFGELTLEHLLLDYNGTLALDGAPLPGVWERLGLLARQMSIVVMTADTHGTVQRALAGYPCAVEVVVGTAECGEAQAKEQRVRELGAGGCVFVGNGLIDVLALEAAALGICVLEAEGAASKALLAADMAAPNILSALDMLLKPARLVASLRS